MELYTGYEDLSPYFPITIWATLGDVLYTLLIALFFVVIKSDSGWIAKATKKDYGALAAVGFLLALFVEYKAQFFGLWQYGEAMPIIPFLGVGLTPIVQMALLLPVSVFLAKFFCARYNN